MERFGRSVWAVDPLLASVGGVVPKLRPALRRASSEVARESTARKVELLQQKLEAERKRTWALEQALKAAKQQQ